MNPTRWVMLVAAAVILWLASRGRLADVVYAMEHGDTSTGGMGSASTSTAQGLAGTAAPALGSTWQSGAPDWSYFLSVQPEGPTASGFSYPGAQAADTAGLQSVKPGSVAVADWDYPVPPGSQVHLPAGGPYTVEPSWEPGRTVVVQAPNGGLLEFLHLTTDMATGMTGQQLAGGSVIGTSGSPSGSLELGTGPHLAVVVDQGGAQYLGGQ